MEKHKWFEAVSLGLKNSHGDDYAFMVIRSLYWKLKYEAGINPEEAILGWFGELE